jgi:FlaA1/EpsC-like NDP-sugar epimerase
MQSRGARSQGGEIFVLDMGSPVRIKYLAEQMIRLSGKTPYQDVDIIITGLRPGEKLYEELFHNQEQLDETSHSKILLARHRQVEWETLTAAVDALARLAEASDEPQLRAKLTELVPENRFTTA